MDRRGLYHFIMPVLEGGADEVECADVYRDLILNIRDDVIYKKTCGLLNIGLTPICDENEDFDHFLTLSAKVPLECFVQLLAFRYHKGSFSMTRKFPGSTTLGFTDDYESLEGSTTLGFTDDYESLEFTCGESREKIPLNQKSLFDAVYRIALTDDLDDKTIARSLIILKQMIIEPISDPCFEDLIATNLKKPDFFPTTYMLDVESERQHELQILTRRRGPTGRLVDLREGMLANHYMRNSQRRVVVEVLSVSVSLKKPGFIYGAIYDQDGFLMYNRKEEAAEWISGSQQLLLERSKPIKPTNFVAFVLYLADTQSQSRSVIINDCFGYVPTNNCDRPLAKTCAGSSGSVTLAYVVMSNSNAAQASVEVKLMAGEGEGEGGNPAEVCGELFAGFGCRAYSKHEIMLFRRRTDLKEYAKAKPRDNIMLSRSVVAVPFDSEHLIVRANLHHRDSEGEIAKGIAKFPPNNSGTYKEKIFGKHGQILVTVNWLNTSIV